MTLFPVKRAYRNSLYEQNDDIRKCLFMMVTLNASRAYWLCCLMHYQITQIGVNTILLTVVLFWNLSIKQTSKQCSLLLLHQTALLTVIFISQRAHLLFFPLHFHTCWAGAFLRLSVHSQPLKIQPQWSMNKSSQSTQITFLKPSLSKAAAD